MTNYRAMYLTMLDASERVLELLKCAPKSDLAILFQVAQLLVDAQRQCEDIYIDTAEDK